MITKILILTFLIPYKLLHATVQTGGTIRKVFKGKNISRKIKNGTVLQSSDNDFQGMKNARIDHTNHKGSGKYRRLVVIDSNSKNELAVMKRQTRGHIQVGKSNYHSAIMTLDDNNKPIKAGKKFVVHGKGIPPSEANQIKKKALEHHESGKKNHERLRKLKGRK